MLMYRCCSTAWSGMCMYSVDLYCVVFRLGCVVLCSGMMCLMVLFGGMVYGCGRM